MKAVRQNTIILGWHHTYEHGNYLQVMYEELGKTTQLVISEKDNVHLFNYTSHWQLVNYMHYSVQIPEMVVEELKPYFEEVAAGSRFARTVNPKVWTWPIRKFNEQKTESDV